MIPSDVPSDVPSDIPSMIPSYVPSDMPSDVPSVISSYAPSYLPSMIPSDLPSVMPKSVPSVGPSVVHSFFPSVRPSHLLSQLPSLDASYVPSKEPSIYPSFGLRTADVEIMVEGLSISLALSLDQDIINVTEQFLWMQLSSSVDYYAVESVGVVSIEIIGGTYNRSRRFLQESQSSTAYTILRLNCEGRMPQNTDFSLALKSSFIDGQIPVTSMYQDGVSSDVVLVSLYQPSSDDDMLVSNYPSNLPSSYVNGSNGQTAPSDLPSKIVDNTPSHLYDDAPSSPSLKLATTYPSHYPSILPSKIREEEKSLHPSPFPVISSHLTPLSSRSGFIVAGIFFDLMNETTIQDYEATSAAYYQGKMDNVDFVTVSLISQEIIDENESSNLEFEDENEYVNVNENESVRRFLEMTVDHVTLALVIEISTESEVYFDLGDQVSELQDDEGFVAEYVNILREEVPYFNQTVSLIVVPVPSILPAASPSDTPSAQTTTEGQIADRVIAGVCAAAAAAASASAARTANVVNVSSNNTRSTKSPYAENDIESCEDSEVVWSSFGARFGKTICFRETVNVLTYTDRSVEFSVEALKFGTRDYEPWLHRNTIEVLNNRSVISSGSQQNIETEKNNINEAGEAEIEYGDIEVGQEEVSQIDEGDIEICQDNEEVGTECGSEHTAENEDSEEEVEAEGGLEDAPEDDDDAEEEMIDEHEDEGEGEEDEENESLEGSESELQLTRMDFSRLTFLSCFYMVIYSLKSKDRINKKHSNASSIGKR